MFLMIDHYLSNIELRSDSTVSSAVQTTIPPFRAIASMHEGRSTCSAGCLEIMTSSHHGVFMSTAVRTTLHLDSDVYRAARSLAASRGSGRGIVISELARKGVRAPLPAGGTQRGFPTFDVPADASPLTSEMVRLAVDDE